MAPGGSHPSPPLKGGPHHLWGWLAGHPTPFLSFFFFFFLKKICIILRVLYVNFDFKLGSLSLFTNLINGIEVLVSKWLFNALFW